VIGHESPDQGFELGLPADEAEICKDGGREARASGGWSRAEALATEDPSLEGIGFR
jgi:hypothetical protein